MAQSMGSGTHCSNIDGFLGTHANGATDQKAFFRNYYFKKVDMDFFAGFLDRF